VATIPEAPWRPAGWSDFSALLGLNLSSASVYYGVAQATNGAGLVSPVRHSAPLQVGLNAIPASATLQQVLAFDTQLSSTVFPQNGTSPGQTTGALVAAPGTLSDGTYLVAGVVGSSLQPSVGNSTVDPRNTTAPPNFMFDGYSFSA
jgi:hypothetical protein